MLQALCPPPFQNADQERHNLLCPAQALDAYVHRAALWHRNEQLFVCFGPSPFGPFTPDRHSSLWWGYINVPLKHQNRRNRVPLKGNVRLQL